MIWRVTLAVAAACAAVGLILGITDGDWLSIACAGFALVLVAALVGDRDT